MHVKSLFRLKVSLALIVFSFNLAACSGFLVPAPTDSGINGLVTIGPMCPVMQVGNPCPDKPFQATLSVLTADGQHEVTQFETDPNGYFQVDLVPGKYILHPESPKSGMPHGRDIPFTVEAHLFTRLEVAYDSGIR
ncbi:MAG: hypothetical protein ACXWNC_06990 [Anaerolineales bacterium]